MLIVAIELSSMVTNRRSDTENSFSANTRPAAMPTVREPTAIDEEERMWADHYLRPKLTRESPSPTVGRSSRFCSYSNLLSKKDCYSEPRWCSNVDSRQRQRSCSGGSHRGVGWKSETTSYCARRTCNWASRTEWNPLHYGDRALQYRGATSARD